MASRLAKRCAAKFKRITALNTLIDTGNEYERQVASKAKRVMPNSWTKRQSNHVQGFWKAKEHKK
jgi:hypothetical protein